MNIIQRYRRYSPLNKLFIWAAIAGFIGVGLALVGVFKPDSPSVEDMGQAPFDALAVESYIYPESYPEGITVSGIKWQRSFSDLRVTITNQSIWPLTYIDLFVRTDQNIVGAAQLTSVPTLRLDPVSDNPNVWLKSNELQSYPVIPIGPVSSAIYRIQCERLSPRDKIHILFATVKINPMVNGNFPEKLFADRQPPTLFELTGQLIQESDVIKRRYHVSRRFSF